MSARQFCVKQHFPITVSLIVLLVGIGADTASQALQFYRPGILAGQWWRILTGHLVHLNWGHLVLNIAGLILVWAFFHATIVRTYWYAVFLLCLLINGLLLFFLDEDLVAYVGLSGVLHGLFIFGGLCELRLRLWRNAIVLLAVVWGKLLWEQFMGSLPGTTDLAGGSVYVNAHLYGAYAGVVAAIALPRRALVS